MRTLYDGSKIKEVSLSTGDLTITVDSSDFKLDDIIGFAARRNKKRGFLFVNRLLAKYYPSVPSRMNEMNDYFADKLVDMNIGENALFIGMAEAAVCFGHGVYDAYCTRTTYDNQYIHTTRHKLDGYMGVEFKEEHSHASDFYLYSNENPTFTSAKTVVIIDDEITTGKTVVNLIKQYTEQFNDNVTKVIVVSMLNLVPQTTRDVINSFFEFDVEFIQTINASVTFNKNSNVKPSIVPSAKSTNESKNDVVSLDYGRIGVNGPVDVKSQLEFCQQSVRADSTVLIIGTGEFTYPAHLIASQIEPLVDSVHLLSTARNPMEVGNDIKTVISLGDNYGDDIMNYIYNLDVNAYDVIFICTETNTNKNLLSFAEQINATVLGFK